MDSIDSRSTFGSTDAGAGTSASKAQAKPLKGDGRYILAWNILMGSGARFQRDDFHQAYLYNGERVTDALIRGYVTISSNKKRKTPEKITSLTPYMDLAT